VERYQGFGGVMKGVLVISTALALFAAGSVQTHSRSLMSQVAMAASDRAAPSANASPAGPSVGRTPATPDRTSSPTAAAKATTGRTRSDRLQQPVATSTTTREARVVPTAMLAPASLPSDPKLVSKIQSLLPAGMAADQAAFGFRTQMQFVSAVFAARNLEIPFDELKTRLLTQGLTLDESIRALRPKADATAEADRALRQADTELSNPD
jgi:hypothetical protein